MIVLHHGTSSVFVERILSEGLRPDPPVALSAAVDPEHPDAALPGVYGAADRDAAVWYARTAADRFGGEPIIAVLRIDESELLPDEDDVHHASAHCLALSVGYDPGGTGARTKDWSPSTARDAADMTARDLGCRDPDLDTAAGALHAMVGAIPNDAWVRNPHLLRPVDGSWSSPAWRRELVAALGVGFYRRRMDELCRAMPGCDPERASGGLSGFKARSTRVLRVGGNVVGIGGPDDPWSIHDGSASLDGSETSYGLEWMPGRPPSP